MKNKAAQQLGMLGGKAKSEAKSEAARLNGQKGGRPRKNPCSTCNKDIPKSQTEKLGMCEDCVAHWSE